METDYRAAAMRALARADQAAGPSEGMEWFDVVAENLALARLVERRRQRFGDLPEQGRNVVPMHNKRRRG